MYLHNVPRHLFPPTFFVERPMRFDGEVAGGLRHPGESPGPAVDPAVAEQLRSVGYLR